MQELSALICCNCQAEKCSRIKLFLDSGNSDEMDFNATEMSILMEANRKLQRLHLKE